MYYINETLELGGNIDYLYSKNPEFQNFMLFCGWVAIYVKDGLRGKEKLLLFLIHAMLRRKLFYTRLSLNIYSIVKQSPFGTNTVLLKEKLVKFVRK